MATSTLGQLAHPHPPCKPSCADRQLGVKGGFVSVVGAEGGTQTNPVLESQTVVYRMLSVCLPSWQSADFEGGQTGMTASH